jgi:hypothetical protein
MSTSEKETKLQQDILALLKAEDNYVLTLEIAKKVLGDDAKASNVNPSLYALLGRKLVKKKAEANGTKPKWKAAKLK